MRLREPWRKETVPNGIRCHRRFGYPGRIDDYERVWLVFEGLTGPATVALNGHELGRQGCREGSLEFEISALLQPRNELVLEIEQSGDLGRIWEEVALEVRCLAWLKEVRVGFVNDQGNRLVVDGVVKGVSPGVLELYVVLGRSPLLYSTIHPSPGGEPFHLRSDPLTEDIAAQPTLPVRVELVNGAVPWCTVDMEVNRE
jgi:hypothetical protein